MFRWLPETRVVVARAGSSATLIPFVVDPQSGGGDVFDIASLEPNALVSLILPDGSEINAANAEGHGFTFLVLPATEPGNGQILSLLSKPGAHTLFELPPSSPAGNYQVKVNASAVTSDALVMASYISSSPLRVGLITDAPQYRIGDTVVLSGFLFNRSTPVTNATVTAAIGDPSHPEIAPVEVTLRDSGSLDAAVGDGIFTGTFTANRAGEFTAGIRATGTSAAGASFSRFATTTFRVTQPLATFVSFQDQAIDDDGNGRFDQVVVTANLDVQTEGDYEFYLALQASNGLKSRARTNVSLSQGQQEVSLSFPWKEISKLGVNGPYTLHDAMLTFEGETPFIRADYRENAGNTSAYTLSTLERRPIVFTGRNTATGIDTNGNGKFDILRIQAEVNVDRAGDYHWSGSLNRDPGAAIDSFNNTSPLSAGSNTITIDLDGSKIGRNGLDGPYDVSVVIFGMGKSLIVDKLFDSPAYSFRQFEGARCRADVNSDGIVNNADIEIVRDALGTHASDPDYNPLADVIWDSVSGIDDADLSFVIQQSGCTTLPPNDSVPPATTIALSQTPNASGWHNSNVTVTFNATDNQGGSGVREINYSATSAQSLPVTTVNGASASLTITAEGVTVVSFYAKDSAGNTEATKTITLRLDKTGPTITNASVDKAELWPPNHKMVNVTVNYGGADNLDPNPRYTLGVASNEPVNGTGDGDTSPDWEVIDGHHVRLRVERAGSGNGRIYTITITGMDQSGNSSSRIVTVRVPRNRS